MKIGCIGCGNMAKPILNGIASSAIAAPEDIYVTDVNRDALKTFCEACGLRVSTQEEILCACDTVILAVKPQILPELLPQTAEAVNRRDLLVISIAAGKTTDYIGSFYHESVAVARIFPNLNAKVGAAVSAYCGNQNVTASQLETVKTICESFGAAFYVPEAQINIFGVLGGCAPA